MTKGEIFPATVPILPKSTDKGDGNATPSSAATLLSPLYNSLPDQDNNGTSSAPDSPPKSVSIQAPATLPEGYRFTVKHGDSTIVATVVGD